MEPFKDYLEATKSSKGKTHKIKHEDYIDIEGNKRNANHPIQVIISSQNDTNPEFKPKKGEPENAFLLARAISIVKDGKNFGKHSVKDQTTNVKYGDILDTPQGKFRLKEKSLSDGKLELIKEDNYSEAKKEVTTKDWSTKGKLDKFFAEKLFNKKNLTDKALITLIWMSIEKAATDSDRNLKEMIRTLKAYIV